MTELRAINCALDGAAIGMTEHDDQFCAGKVAGKLHAAEDVVSEHVTRDARVKNVADTLIEDEFDGLT